MKLPDDLGWTRAAVGLSLALALGACGMLTGGSPATQSAAVFAPNGPQADYPVIIGDPYQVAGTTYTPEDVMNYDEVGFLAADQQGGAAITGAHHTLPLPSYVEVTSLETGRTILARMERRGPMTGTQLVALSPGAMRELEAVAGSPIRVRRVNPPEDQRTLLRAGQAAQLRMDTPMSLVSVLKRKLPTGAGAAMTAPPAPANTVASAAAPAPTRVTPAATARSSESGARELPASTSASSPPLLAPLDDLPNGPAAASAPSFEASFPRPRLGPASTARSPESGFVVQAAAFSTADRAQSVANRLGGAVSRSGRYFRVRTGPFATRGQAEASLAKVKAAGYRDARIFTSG